MIYIAYEPNESRLKVKGHAEFDVIGKDIVCSAASMLVQTFGSVCTSMDKAGWTTKPTKLLMDSGNALIQAYPRTHTCYVCRCKLDAIAEGFVILAQSYPENVIFKIE